MTAVNVIARRERVTVATDSAFYDGSGCIQGFAPKAIAMPCWPGVVAMRGPIYVLARLAAEAGLRFADVDGFADGAPGFLEDFLEEHGHMLGQVGEVAGIQVTVAGLSRARNACRAFVIQAGERWDVPGARWIQGESADVPNDQVLEVPADTLCMSPPVLEAEQRAVGIDPDMDLSRLGLADERKLAIRLMEAQRRLCMPLNVASDPIHFVGGQPVFLTVFRDGTILTSTGPAWPDVIGERIELDRDAAA